MNLPSQYKENMKNLLNDEYDQYIDSFKQDRVYGLRVNTNKISVEDFLKISPFKLEPVSWCKEGFYYDGNVDRPAKHPYYYAGLYYLQEPSAMSVASIVDVKDGDVILDGCAAPGGKSSQLLAKMKNKGVLISNDISASRCIGLLKNLQLTGCDNYKVISSDLVELSKRISNCFDTILLDAPCSGEGMFRKDSSLINSWLEKGNDYYKQRQMEIVEAALKMLKEDGQIIYSTCTFSLKEDEEVIDYLLSLDENLYLAPFEKSEGFSNGVGEKFFNCARLYPHKIKGEGHFLALIKRKNATFRSQSLKNNVSYDNIQSAQDFLKLVNRGWANGKFENINDKIYFSKDVPFELKGIRTISSGLLIGTVKKDRFEPSTALALSLKKDQFTNVLDLKVDDVRVIKYLKGETIKIDEPDVKDGYVLVCVDGYSLGFGKNSGGVLKNKYEVNYRWV